jgi:hypothetical protein
LIERPVWVSPTKATNVFSLTKLKDNSHTSNHSHSCKLDFVGDGGGFSGEEFLRSGPANKEDDSPLI